MNRSLIISISLFLGPWTADTSRGTVLVGIHSRGQMCSNTSIPHAAIRISNPEILNWIYSNTGNGYCHESKALYHDS